MDRPSGSPRAPSVPERIQSLRESLVDRIWSGLLIIALFGVPASILRTLSTGWLNIYSTHIALGLVVLAVFFLRRHLSVGLKIALVMLLFWAVGLAGLKTFGLLGAGIWWLVMSSLLMSTLYSLRAGLITMSAVVLIVAAAGLAFSSGTLRVAVDANAYVASPLSWITVMIATALMPLIVFQATAGLQRTTVQLLHEVERQRRQIEHIATHDPLCGLPTRHLAKDRLQQALRAIPRTRRKVAVLFIDLDGFKAINDEHGHAAGDAVLLTVGRRLCGCARAMDTVARMGGDEFIAILEGVNSPEDAMQVGRSMVDAIRQPVEFAGQRLRVGASIGVALAPDHALSAEALIQTADAAMYRAKHEGKDQAVLADPVCDANRA